MKNWTVDEYGTADDGTGRFSTSAEIIDDDLHVEHFVPTDMGSYYAEHTAIPLSIVAELLRRAGYTVSAPMPARGEG